MEANLLMGIKTNNFVMMVSDLELGNRGFRMPTGELRSSASMGLK